MAGCPHPHYNDFNVVCLKAIDQNKRKKWYVCVSERERKIELFALCGVIILVSQNE